MGRGRETNKATRVDSFINKFVYVEHGSVLLPRVQGRMLHMRDESEEEETRLIIIARRGRSKKKKKEREREKFISTDGAARPRQLCREKARENEAGSTQPPSQAAAVARLDKIFNF